MAKEIEITINDVQAETILDALDDRIYRLEDKLSNEENESMRHYYDKEIDKTYNVKLYVEAETACIFDEDTK